MASALRSFVDWGRDRFTPVTHTSTFRESGQITPEEFVQAGDYLVYKFPSWSWSDAATPSKRVAYLPAEKQFLVTRGVPCRRRIDDDFAGNSAVDDLVRDGFLGGPDEPGDDADDGWLRTGGTSEKEQTALREEVRTMSESGQLSKAAEEEDEIPDIDDDDDDNEAIIRDKVDPSSQATRTYTLYITYTPYYRTPRMYLSGYSSPSTPLEPMLMLDDIVGDYKERTVTLEDFPFADGGSVKMASIHPCKHASVMKIMLDRADAALKIRLQKAKAQGSGSSQKISGMEGLIDDTSKLALQETQKRGHEAGVKAAGGDDWEVLDQAENEEDKVAIRVDQYLVVFLKFMGSLCPTIEHDFTMGV